MYKYCVKVFEKVLLIKVLDKVFISPMFSQYTWWNGSQTHGNMYTVSITHIAACITQQIMYRVVLFQNHQQLKYSCDPENW